MTESGAPDVVVIGAGPAGLAAAHRAVAKGCRVTVIEKTGLMGGKGASRQYGDFIVDFGPHTFHAMSRAVTELIEKYGGAELEEIPIRQELYISSKPMRYPLSLGEAARVLPPVVLAKSAVDLLFARIAARLGGATEDNFKSYGHSRFGKTLYRICFGDYSERVWESDASELSVEFAKRKLPNLSVAHFIRELISGVRSENKKSYLHVRRYLYHRRGIGRVFESMARDLEKRGVRFITGARITAVHFSELSGNATKISLSQPDDRMVACDFLVSTCPMSDLVGYFPTEHSEPKELTSHLPFRHGLIVNAVLARPKLMEAHWAYLVNERFSFNRMSEPKNFSSQSAPPDKTLIMLEKICTPDGAAWRREAENWRADVEKELAFFGVAPKEIEEIFLTRMEKAFPFYKVGYESKKAEFFNGLARHRNIVSAGRYGLFMDINMHDSMALGFEAVEHVMSDRVAEYYETHESIPFRYRDL